MSTVKAKAEVAAPEPETKLMEITPAPEAPRSRITPFADVPKYEAMVGRKFVKKDGTTNGEVFIPKSIIPFWVMGADDMGDGDGNTPAIMKFYVEKSHTNGEPEAAAPLIILGREIRARPPVREFMIECAKFAVEYEEKRD